MLAAGLDGIRNNIPCPPPVNDVNLYEMTDQELEENGINQLPGSLAEALLELEQNTVLMDVLGSDATDAFLRAKWEEWDAYRTRVMDWEVETYLHKA